MKSAALLLGAILVLCSPIPPRAETRSFSRPDLSAPVTFTADVVNVVRGGERVEANGHVVIQWGGARLTGARVVYRPGSGGVEASGEVELVDEDGNRLTADALELDLDTQEGVVHGGNLWVVREGYHVWGDPIRKTGPRSYRVDKGGFTSCDGTVPSWRVEADRVEVELEGYLVARGAAFWVEGVPVAYTPYLVFPVIQERRSGLLTPRVGFTTSDGLKLQTRYFWAPADAYDVTFGVDYRSRRGWAESARLRYALEGDTTGWVRGEHLGDRTTRGHRYTLEGEHKGRTAAGTRLEVRADFVSDTDVSSDLGDSIDRRGQERLRSYALAARDTAWGTPNALVDFNQNLRTEQDETLQTLPAVGVEGRPIPLWGPLTLDPTVQATRFWRSTGQRGTRLRLDPEAALDLGGAGAGLTGRVGYRQNLYDTNGRRVSRGAAHAQVGTSATLWRPVGPWIHTVEPRIALNWQETGRGGAPPQFDLYDRFSANTDVSALVETRLLSVGDLTPVAGADLEGRYEPGKGRVSALRAEAFWTPPERWSLQVDGTWDPSRGDPLERWAASAETRTRRGDLGFVRYRYQKQVSSYLDAGVEVNLGRISTLQYRRRHSLRDRRALEVDYGLAVHHPCWEVGFTISRHWREEDDRYEHRYYLQLDLKGLGRLGTWKGVLQ